MSPHDVLSAATEAWALLAAHPLQWTGVVLVFLVVVEIWMLVPYVGFVLKLAVAGVVGAQVIAMFDAAARGRSPSPLDLAAAFGLPLEAQAALVFAALLPFAAGMLFLRFKAGPSALRFFFGHIFKAAPPSKTLFVQSKYVMQLAALPFTLLMGAVALQGLSGVAAIAASLVAAATHWLPLLVLGLLGFAFEWGCGQLPALMPKAAAAAVGGFLLVAFLACTFAITYTVSARAFGVNATAPAAPAP